MSEYQSMVFKARQNLIAMIRKTIPFDNTYARFYFSYLPDDEAKVIKPKLIELGMREPSHIIIFDDLSPILREFINEDKEKLRRIFDGEGIRVIFFSITAVWKCPLCFTNDRTIACLSSQEQVDEYKKKPHYCPRCQRSKGIEIGMALVGSNK